MKIFLSRYGIHLSKTTVLYLSVVIMRKKPRYKSSKKHKIFDNLLNQNFSIYEKNKIWYIDEPSAETIKKILEICLVGKCPSQVARQLEKEKILTSSTYFNSINRKTSNLSPKNIYEWSPNIIKFFILHEDAHKM